jgi:hypothetical protein
MERREPAAYPGGMAHGIDKRFAELLEENGRPVTPEGLAQARTKLAAAADRRNADARAALLERLRTAA